MKTEGQERNGSFKWEKVRVVRLYIFLSIVFGAAAALLYYGWTGRASDKAMLDLGVETKAHITGARAVPGRKGTVTYYIDFAWRDAAQQERAIKSVDVSDEVWKRLVSGNRLVVNEIPIKYLESDTNPRAILIWDAHYALRIDFVMLCGGAVLTLLGGAILAMQLRSNRGTPNRPAAA
jgi:hypothetical protein